jgi:hypothetical protein
MSKSKIRTILQNHKIPDDVYYDFSMPETRTNDNLKSCEAAILALIAEAIGDDETEYSNLDGDAGYWEKHGRNQLRAEIRERLGLS